MSSLLDILDDIGATLADSIGGRYIHCDVSKEAHVESAVELALKWKGRIDIMFNNAGVPGPSESISSLDMEQVKDLLSINVLGVVHGIKYAAAAMIKGRRGGSIICTSSSAGIMGGLGGHAYTLSKETLNGLATVEDVAEAALFMASKDTGFITGHNLVLDGGYTSACSTIYQNSNKDTV